MRKIKVDLGLIIEVEYPGALDTSVLRRIFRATRGDGDIRKGINMNADIGWYVANKLQENIDNTYADDCVKIGNHSIHIKKVKESK